MSSLPKAQDETRHDQLKQQQIQDELQAAGSSFTLWRNENNITNTTSLVLAKKNKAEESDEDLFTVPDVESQPIGVNAATGCVIKESHSNDDGNQDQDQDQDQQQPDGLSSAGKRRRGRNPADKEYRRIKRLLRNRVSAQQARERKKFYVNELESRAKELQDRYAKLEERISTLTNENAMLRKVLMNTRPTKCDGNNELKDDQPSKS